jgi:hypothetical protein
LSARALATAGPGIEASFMIHTRSGRRTLGVALSFLAALAGCTSFGPANVQRDRFEFNSAVARSWKEQTLLNIVRLRYLDTPLFLDVSQIVGGYTLEGTVSLGGTGNSSTAPAAIGNTLSVGTAGRWAVNPTITYTPLTGAQFSQKLLTPISPNAVLWGVQAGWPIDLIMRLCVQGVNGIKMDGPTAPQFDRMGQLLRELQLKDLIGVRLPEEGAAQKDPVIFFPPPEEVEPELEAKIQELREILRLPRGERAFTVVHGTQATHNREIVLFTRSMLLMMGFGANVQVPESDVTERRANPARRLEAIGLGQVRVRYSEKRPADADVHTLVAYRNGWYWIDDRDLESKRTFGLLMLLLTLMETGARSSLPVVTIPSR